MKKILFLLLSTIAMYGQVPADATQLENIQITNNTTSLTATKVNVQDANGVINTIPKSDLVNVVEVNDVPSLPLIGEAGKIYVVKNLNKIYRWNGTFYQELAVTDISGKENSANKQNSLAVDATNLKYPTVTAVNAGLNLKSNLSDITLQRAYDTSTDKKIQTLAIRPFTLKAQTAAASDNVFVIENSSGFEVASVGAQGKLSAISASVEGNVTGNFFIKRSSPITNILLAGGGDLAQGTAFNKNFGTTAGTVAEGNDSRFTDARNPLPNSPNYIQNQNGSAQAANMWISGSGTFGSSVTTSGKILNIGSSVGQFQNYTTFINGVYSGLNAASPSEGVGMWSDNQGNASIGALYNNTASSLNFALRSSSSTNGFIALKLTGTSGAAIFSSTVTATSFNGSATLTGTPTAPTATAGTNTTQIATTAFVQAAARPYKVYTALLSQSGTNAPVATVLENTLGGAVVWSRTNAGQYLGTLTGAFTSGKTIVFATTGQLGTVLTNTYSISVNTVSVDTFSTIDTAFRIDDAMLKSAFEIRVYP